MPKITRSISIKDYFSHLKVSEHRIVIDTAGQEAKFIKDFRESRSIYDLFKEQATIRKTVNPGEKEFTVIQYDKHLLSAIDFIKGKKDPLSKEELSQLFHNLVEYYSGKIRQVTPEPLPEIPKLGNNPEAAYSLFVMCTPDEGDGRDLEEKARTRYEWEILRRTVESRGGKVVVIDGNVSGKGSPREAFVRDPVLVIGDTVYFPKQFFSIDAYWTLSAEGKQLVEKLRALGFDKFKPVNTRFEGGDVLYDPIRDKIFFGVDYPVTQETRNDIKNLSKVTGLKVIPVPKTKAQPLQEEDSKKDFYHLDTFMTILPNGEVLLYEDATTPEAVVAVKQEMLTDASGKRVNTDYFVLDQKSAEELATNIIPVGKSLITPYMSQELETALEKRGYEVVTPKKLGLGVDFQFRLGGPHCLVLNVPDPAQWKIHTPDRERNGNPLPSSELPCDDMAAALYQAQEMGIGPLDNDARVSASVPKQQKSSHLSK